MISIAVLLTVHNRKHKTLSCLRTLFSNFSQNFSFEVFMVDDGCTDGTSEEVAIQFPQVTIINGDGNLFWNRGMRKAWEVASLNKSFDSYLWLNDDVILFKNALNLLVETSMQFKDSIICGTTKSQINDEWTYGGYVKVSHNKFIKIIPNGTTQECDTFNGNFVLVPKSVFQKIGYLDDYFSHGLGDFDYGLRARKDNIAIYVLSDFIGNCENDKKAPLWLTKDKSIIARLISLYSPLGNNPKQFFCYQYRHFGLLYAIKYFISIHIKAIFKLKK